MRLVLVTSRTQSLIDHSHELHLSQVLMGMRILIRDGREKPIDRLMKNILLLDVHFPFLFYVGNQHAGERVRQHRIEQRNARGGGIRGGDH